jgi:two-component system heavy metal sensor histidine kinase CusS
VKSISSRLTLWYALTATATLACLFVIGYFMLERHLINQLDQLNEQQFRQLRTVLGPHYNEFPPEEIEKRIRDVTESASSLFYIDMHASMTNRFFKSHNLQGRAIPDIPGQRAFTVDMSDLGTTLRASEFLLPPFDVMVATPLAPVYDLMQGYERVCIALTLLMALLSTAIGFGLSQLVLRPVRVIRDTANRIRSDNLKERIPVAVVKDEISQLAKLLNQMFDRLEVSFDQIRRFTADASHELKTPLSLVRLHAERLLMTGELGPAPRESIHVQLEELARVNQIIDELLFLSRADAQAIPVDLRSQTPAEFLQTFAQDASALAEHHGRRFSYTHEGDGTVDFEEKRMRQVLLNLLANALNVSPPGGAITLKSVLAGGLWQVSVEDEGPGLDAEQRNKIFERFVRFGPQAASDKGSGLGLAICRSIVQLHKGRIFATQPETGRGMRMVIEIPAAASASAAS